MREFVSGRLKSSSGDKVTDRNQAIAIALSEAKKKKKKKSFNRDDVKQARKMLV